MSKERLIWRPNEIPPNEWEAMSREDQIRWWKDRQSPPAPKPQMKKAINQYNRGAYTHQDFCRFVEQFAAPEEIAEFVQDCPPELLEVLKGDLAEYGPDESQWPRMFFIGSYFPWVSAEEITVSQRQVQEQIWNGVRLLKKHLG